MGAQLSLGPPQSSRDPASVSCDSNWGRLSRHAAALSRQGYVTGDPRCCQDHQEPRWFMELWLWSVISALPKMKRHSCAYDKRTHRPVCLACVSPLFKSVGQDAFPFQDPRSAWRAVVLNSGMCSPSGTLPRDILTVARLLS